MSPEQRRTTILAALAAGLSSAQAGRAAGVSGARARRIAKETGLPPKRAGLPPSSANGGLGVRSARGTTLLLRLTLAAADRGLTPEQFLEAAERSVGQCAAPDVPSQP